MKEDNFSGLSKWRLDTPCLVIALEILEENIRSMQAYVGGRGKNLRPHAKTHKCSRIARMQMDAGCAGICVAKVSEAEALIAAGLRGVLVTSPVVTEQKIEGLMDCLLRDPELIAVVDDPGNARRLNAAVAAKGRRLNVLVDLDPGMGRTGISFQDAPALGQLMSNLPALRLRGIQCYAGHVQHIASFRERSAKSRAWMEQAAEVARQFRRMGLPVEIFTGAGTGTYEIDCQVPELTDLQTGSYTLMDAEYLGIGTSRDPNRFSDFPPALTLLTTVISAHQSGCVTVDAGLKTLYHHGGTPYVLRPAGPGYVYEWWGDEHGRISFAEGTRRPQMGEVLELVVSHCDPTVNLFDAFYVTRKEIVTEVWPIDLRGKSQ